MTVSYIARIKSDWKRRSTSIFSIESLNSKLNSHMLMIYGLPNNVCILYVAAAQFMHFFSAAFSIVFTMHSDTINFGNWQIQNTSTSCFGSLLSSTPFTGERPWELSDLVERAGDWSPSILLSSDGLPCSALLVLDSKPSSSFHRDLNAASSSVSQVYQKKWCNSRSWKWWTTIRL